MSSSGNTPIPEFKSNQATAGTVREILDRPQRPMAKHPRRTDQERPFPSIRG